MCPLAAVLCSQGMAQLLEEVSFDIGSKHTAWHSTTACTVFAASLQGGRGAACPCDY